MRRVQIAVFAHNEESDIADLLRDLDAQTLFSDEQTDVQLRVLCNGCRDDTVGTAARMIQDSVNLLPVTTVDDLPQGGKSRTWNYFVNQLAAECDVVVFIDADIRMTSTHNLQFLIEDLLGSEAVAATSWPRKDLTKLRRRPLLRVAANVIKATHRDGPIAGSLYAVRAAAIRGIQLPVPCLVEDGFLSACLITGLFSHDAIPGRVKASSRAFHWFTPPQTLSEFFHHDVRLRLGCEINAALYTALWRADSQQERESLLRDFAESKRISTLLQEHDLHPDRSALNYPAFTSMAWRAGSGTVLRKCVESPIRIMHWVYRMAVTKRARQVHRERRYQW